jgi:ElaB/YqjD/DUF883 family membrane-anchored ribosome-binding protein
MDQRQSDIRQDIEGTRAAMTEKIGMVEERVQETAAEVKSTVDSAMEGFKQVQGTVEEAKSAIDKLIDSVKETANDMVDGVKQNPWLMVGSAGLLGYILGSLASERSSSLGRTKQRAHDTREQASGYPEAVIQCSKCGQMVHQADMVSHSATCTGQGLSSHGGTP